MSRQTSKRVYYANTFRSPWKRVWVLAREGLHVMLLFSVHVLLTTNNYDEGGRITDIYIYIKSHQSLDRHPMEGWHRSNDVIHIKMPRCENA